MVKDAIETDTSIVKKMQKGDLNSPKNDGKTASISIS
jgi:hypothetical protein